MNKLGKFLVGLWAVLALISFVVAFFIPTFPKIINITFGALNLMVILNYIVTYFRLMYFKNKMKKIKEEDGM